MKTINVKVYEFDELSDGAKENARIWYRNGALDYDWWETMYDDAKSVGLKITGFDLDRNRHATGEFITSARECADAILKQHGESCESFKTAEAFLKERDEIVDTAPKDENGEFENEHELDGKLDDCEADFLKAILEDYSVMLQNEYEYLLSDENVDETIRINKYTFTKDGKRFLPVS